MGLDHEAIYKAYAGTVVTIDDGRGAFDGSGNPVIITGQDVFILCWFGKTFRNT